MLSSPKIIIHNGNFQIKPWLARRWSVDCLPNISDHWKFSNCDLDSVHERVQYMKKHGTCVSDVTIADQIPLEYLLALTDDIKFIKVASSYQGDRSNLDASWNINDYDESQWYNALIYGLSFCHEFLWWDQFSLTSVNDQPPIVFTPGRCGTHLLLNILNLRSDQYLHHTHNTINTEKFQKLTGASTIYAILRKNFLQQTLSDLVAKKTEQYMLTTASTLERNRNLLAQLAPIKFNTNDCISSFKKTQAYVDILLGLKYYYNKKIVFTFYEDLQHHYARTTYVKNPWNSETLVENYQLAQIQCNYYQKSYDHIINNVKSVLGASLFYV